MATADSLRGIRSRDDGVSVRPHLLSMAVTDELVLPVLASEPGEVSTTPTAPLAWPLVSRALAGW